MHFTSVVAVLVAVAAASARQIDVLVGSNGTLTFNPSTVTAAVGDVMAFTFMSKNHTITQSTFNSPCTNHSSPMTGVDSGFVPVPANATSFPQYKFTVRNASAPLWFYCRQGQHCRSGMVFAINPSAERTFDAFKARAMGNAPPASGSAGPSASPTAGGADPSTATGAATPSSGAIRLAGSTGLLALVGLVAGLTL